MAKNTLSSFSNIQSKSPGTVYILLITGMMVLFGSLIFNQNVWLDEVYTISYVQHSYAWIWEHMSGDIAPPLYYLSLKLFCDIFGYDIWIMKAFSLLACIAMLFLGAFPIRKGFGDKPAWLFMLLCLTMPFVMKYAVELRMYSWAMFFVTASAVYAYRILQTGSMVAWVLYVIVSVMGTYTHTYALLGIGAIFLLLGSYILLKERTQWKAVVLAGILLLACYYFWLYPLLNQVAAVSSEGFWITFSIRDLLHMPAVVLYLSNTVTTFLFLVFVLALSVYLLLRMILKQPKVEKDWFSLNCLLAFSLVFVFALLYSLIIQPVLIARYLIPLMGLYLLFLAIQLAEVKSKNILVAVCIIMVVVSGIQYNAQYQSEYDSGVAEFKQQFERVIGENDVFVYQDKHAYGVISFYYPEQIHIYLPDNTTYSFELRTGDKSDIENAISEGNAVWMFCRREGERQMQPQVSMSYVWVHTLHTGDDRFDLYELTQP